MSVALDRICGQVFDQPLLYHPQKAETLARLLGPRLTGHSISLVNGEGAVDHVAFANGRPSTGVIGDGLGRAFDRKGISTFDMVEGVAIIPIEGTLVHKGGYIGSSSGETSYQGLQTQIARAKKRADVRGVVFEVDSFGGQGNGAFDTADAIRDLSKAKPTIAILTDFAYSAGYMLASQARQVIMPEFGGAGSIGVVMLHADFSGNLEQDGIKVTLIHAGKHKVDGNPYQPLPAGLAERWQAECEVMRDRFAGVVAAGRGKRFSKAAALKTEAECFNAAEALRLGLVDAVGNGQEAFAAFISAVNGKD
ncbi:S49 family peptidase [Mesorhizobium sp. M0965]|uniref:S49 family peptidase n=1 Tax=Mesorhizobium sp. M0965 TaxID=2957036 RepID=UPI00333575D9